MSRKKMLLLVMAYLVISWFALVYGALWLVEVWK